MSLLYNANANLEKKERKLPEEGTTIGVIQKVIYLGEQVTEFEGIKSNKHKWRITFELPLITAVFNEEKGEQPFVVDREYNFSIIAPDKMGKYNAPFSKLLLSLGGKEAYAQFYSDYTLRATTEEEVIDFLLDYLGVHTACQIEIIHKADKQGNLWANVGDTTNLMKGTQIPKRTNKYFVYDLYRNHNKFDELPEFLQDRIRQSITWNANLKNYQPITSTPKKADEVLPTINADDLNVQMPF